MLFLGLIPVGALAGLVWYHVVYLRRHNLKYKELLKKRVFVGAGMIVGLMMGIVIPCFIPTTTNDIVIRTPIHKNGDLALIVYGGDPWYFPEDPNEAVRLNEIWTVVPEHNDYAPELVKIRKDVCEDHITWWSFCANGMVSYEFHLPEESILQLKY